MADIDRAEVLRIADLARLDLSDAELGRMTEELGAILRHVRELEAVDVEGVPPTAHVMIEALALREDAPGEQLTVDTALAEAPRGLDGAFAVPAFVDEDK